MNAVYEQLDARASAVTDRVIGWSHHLHPHPELSNRRLLVPMNQDRRRRLSGKVN